MAIGMNFIHDGTKNNIQSQNGQFFKNLCSKAARVYAIIFVNENEI